MSSIESIINSQYFSDEDIKTFIASCFIPKIGPLRQMKRDMVERSLSYSINCIDRCIQAEFFHSEYSFRLDASVKSNHTYKKPLNRLVDIMFDIEKKTDNVNKPFKFIGSLVKRINPYDYVTKIISAASISISVSCIKESLIEYYRALLSGKSEEESLDLLESYYKYLFREKVLSCF